MTIFSSSTGQNGTGVDGVLDATQVKILAYTYMAMSFLSMAGAGSIVGVAIAKKKVCNPEVHPIFQLSLADFIASLFLFAGAMFYVTNAGRKSRKTYCSYLTGLTSSWYMSTFLMTVVYGYEVYVKMKDRLVRRVLRSHENVFTQFPLLYFCYSVSWILPVAVSLCIFVMDRGDSSGSLNDDICATCLPVFHYKNSMCFNKDSDDVDDDLDWNEVYKFMFIGLLSLCMIALVVIYIFVFKIFIQVQRAGGVIGQRQYEQESRVRKWASFYQLVFVSCWMPSIVLGCLSVLQKADFTMQKFFGLYVLQAVVSPLQGFLNCILYGWRRKGFTRVIRGHDNANSANEQYSAAGETT